MHEYVKRIHVHGCIAAMEYTLKVGFGLHAGKKKSSKAVWLTPF